VADDFRTLNPAWGSADDNIQLGDKQLLVNVVPHRRFIRFYEATLFNDVDMSIDAAALKGWTDQLVGLVFWGDSADDYYPLVVDPTGDAYVGRILKGKWTGMNVIKGALKNLQKGPGQVNELRVVTRGDSADLLVNNQRVELYKGTPPRGGGMVGLFFESYDDPSNWAFSEFRVRTPLVTLASSGFRTDGLLMTDDFRALYPTWGAGDDVKHVENDKLILTSKPNLGHTLLYDDRFDDADIRVTVTQRTGQPDRPAGIVFWADGYNDYYFAAIRAEGGFVVYQQKAGQWSVPVPLKTIDAVLKGVGQSNTLRVVTKGNTAAIYVNDKQAAALEGTVPKGGGQIGFQGASGPTVYTWEFSNLVVRKPQ
jgi:hypothetical protein